MFTLDINSVIACLRHVRPLYRDHIRHNYVRDALRSKRLIFCHEAGHILPNGLKNFFIFFCYNINKIWNSAIKLDITTQAHIMCTELFNIFPIVTINCNSSVWPTTLIRMNFKAFSFRSILEMTCSRFVFSSKTHSHKQLCHYLPV